MVIETEVWQARRPLSLPLRAAAGCAPVLSRRTAERIIARVSSGLEHTISIVAPSGSVLASSDARLVGMYATIAVVAMAHGEAVSDAQQEPRGLSLPLIYSDRVVGALMIGDTSPSAQATARVAKTLAELIIHQTVVIEHLPRQAWSRDTFLSNLLHRRLEGTPELVAQAAALLHIDPHVPRVVIAVDVGETLDRAAAQAVPATALLHIAAQLRVEQLQQQLIEAAQCIFLPSMADVFGFVDGRVLVLLAPVDPAAPEARRREMIDGVQHLLDQITSGWGGAASAGIGRYYEGWQEIARSYMEACYARETGVALSGPGRVYISDSLGAASFVGNADSALKCALARRLLGPLDTEQTMRTTLETFLRSNLSPSVTATSLQIHRHTVTYRLDKIARLTGCDPRDFESALQFYVALVTERIHGP